MTFFHALKPLVTTLLLFVAGVPLSAAQRRCDGGFFVQDGRCVPCPPGFFRPERIAVLVSSRRCFPCPAGTFNPVSGAITEFVCRRCPENTFSEEGAATCKPCLPGLVSNPASSTCLACGPGTSFTQLNTFRRRNPSRCRPCPRGLFSNGTANPNCDACPEGFTGPRMATSKDTCRLCPPGRYAGLRGCSDCRPGSFKPGRLGACRLCPLGTKSSRGATSCIPCPRGTRNSRLRTQCVDCPSGTTTAAEGGTLCRAEGEPCPRNTFEDSVGNCQRCQIGSFFNVSAKTCQECPPGSASGGLLQTKCQVCPPGARPGKFQDACICDDGMVLTAEGTCEKCPPGSFSRRDVLISNDGRISLGFCSKCPPGMFQDEEGASECKPCPMDSVSSEEGSTKCNRCPVGLVPSIGRTLLDRQDNVLCVLPTTACPPGFRREPHVGAPRSDAIIFYCDRIPCLANTPPEEIGKTCAPCEPGTAPNERRTRCSTCARDEFSSGFKCQKCPDGLIRDPTDGSKCSCRRRAFGIQDGVCSRCRRGTVNNGSSETCQVCPPGTKSISPERCRSCRRGSIAPRAGSARCRECPEGTFSFPAPRGTRCV